MKLTIREYDVVRVAKLIDAERRYDGTHGVARPPRVGDIATVCHEYDPSNDQALVAVEMVDDNGMTIWLADFTREELELIQAYEET